MEQQSPELRKAHLIAKTIEEGLQAAKAMQRHGRVGAQALAQLRDSDHPDLDAAQTVIKDLRRNAYAAANRLGGVRTTTPAQPMEAQHRGTEAA